MMRFEVMVREDAKRGPGFEQLNCTVNASSVRVAVGKALRLFNPHGKASLVIEVTGSTSAAGVKLWGNSPSGQPL